jgi:hypothetical protein
VDHLFQTPVINGAVCFTDNSFVVPLDYCLL